LHKNNKQYYERFKFVEQTQVKIPLYFHPYECADLISLFSKLKEEQLEYPADLLTARKDAFLWHVATKETRSSFLKIKNRI